MPLVEFDQNGFLYSPSLQDRWLSELVIEGEDCVKAQFQSNVDDRTICLEFFGVESFKSSFQGPRVLTELFVSGLQGRTEKEDVKIMESLIPQTQSEQATNRFYEQRVTAGKKHFCVFALIGGYVSFWYSDLAAAG